MFETSFYNAGGTVITYIKLFRFFKSIPKDKYPTILIIGLDQFMFQDSPDYSKPLDQRPTIQFFQH